MTSKLHHDMRRYPYRRVVRDERKKVNLNPQINRGLLAIILFIVAALSTLSFFGLAGVAGQFIDSLLAVAFGSVRYVFPVILITVAALLIKDLEYEYKSTHTIGAVLFLLSFNGIIHLQKPLSEMYDTAIQGYGGGLCGLALSWPLLKYVGYWGGLVILFGLLLIGFIFLFNTSLATIVNLHKKFFFALGWIGKQIIAFFASFKKVPGQEKIKFKIKGAYNKTLGEEVETDTGLEGDEAEDAGLEEADEEERVFEHKSMAKRKSDEEKELADGAKEGAENEEEPIKVEKPKPVYRKLPPLDILHVSKSKPTSGDIKGNAEMIKSTLHNFGIDVDMGEVRVGPTVTQYSLKPSAGIKLTRITTLSNDLALALAAHPIRIEAPIPGKSLVGIEVPNEKVAMVTLRELLEGQEFKNREHNMMIGAGKDVSGKVWFADLPKMPHLLVAGATGSGKTVCINTIILSLIFQNTPETLRFIMVDPKRVELTMYNGIPHLLTPVITDAVKTVNALKWTIGEMDRRFDVLAAAGKRDILSYNKTAAERLPYIVFVIDELADLMAMAPAEVESGIIRIAQMARAVGIHLIVATQRPSVEVITGLMKANIPARIAFSVASIIDSRTILDCPGAEKLLGRGDMLFLTADLSKPVRLQGAYISEEEMKEVVNYLKGDEPPEYDESIVSKGNGTGATVNMFGGPADDQDAMFDEAKQCVIESGKASASLLQRRLKVGYARAARLLDELEEAGIVGPSDGAKPREVFTEHIGGGGGIERPQEEEEIPPEDQTMDAGGTVFDSPTIEAASEADQTDSVDPV